MFENIIDGFFQVVVSTPPRGTLLSDDVVPATDTMVSCRLVPLALYPKCFLITFTLLQCPSPTIDVEMSVAVDATLSQVSNILIPICDTFYLFLLFL